jgi:methionine-rich copper-binding protein CopC
MEISIALGLFGVVLAISAHAVVTALGHAMLTKQKSRAADALKSIAKSLEFWPHEKP